MILVAVKKIRQSLQATQRSHLNPDYLSVITALARAHRGETSHSRGSHRREERPKVSQQPEAEPRHWLGCEVGSGLTQQTLHPSGESHPAWTVKSQLLVFLLQLRTSVVPGFPLKSQPAPHTPTDIPSCCSRSQRHGQADHKLLALPTHCTSGWPGQKQPEG